MNKKAVIRSKAINIRDYAGALILEELKTSLYYAIRVIQDYLKEEILIESQLESLPQELKKAIFTSKEELIRMYNSSNYSILKQYIQRTELTKEEWIDIFTLINLGHYEVTESQIKEAIQVFNEKFSENINNVKQFSSIDKSQQYVRLMERITFMKQNALKKCINMYRKEGKDGN